MNTVTIRACSIVFLVAMCLNITYEMRITFFLVSWVHKTGSARAPNLNQDPFLGAALIATEIISPLEIPGLLDGEYR